MYCTLFIDCYCVEVHSKKEMLKIFKTNLELLLLQSVEGCMCWSVSVICIIYYTEVCDDNDDHDSGQMGFDLMKFNLQKKDSIIYTGHVC